MMMCESSTSLASGWLTIVEAKFIVSWNPPMLHECGGFTATNSLKTEWVVVSVRFCLITIESEAKSWEKLKRKKVYESTAESYRTKQLLFPLPPTWLLTNKTGASDGAK